MAKKNGVSVQKKVGLRIKELRAKTDYSQEALAHLAGLDRTYINSVENGRRNVSINSLAKIVKALGTTLQDFFKSDFFNNKGWFNGPFPVNKVLVSCSKIEMAFQLAEPRRIFAKIYLVIDKLCGNKSDMVKG